MELVEWLRKQQPKASISYQPILITPKEEQEKSTAKQARRDLQQRQQDLIDQFETDPTLKNDRYARLLIDLLRFHERERRPKIWAYYARLAKSDDELFDDNTVVFGIQVTSQTVVNDKLCCEGDYDYTQPIREDKFKTATLWGDEGLKVDQIEFFLPATGSALAKIQFRINDTAFDAKASPLSLLGTDEFVPTIGLETRLCDIVEEYFETHSLNGSLKTLFDQTAPTFGLSASYLPITRKIYEDNEAYLDAIIDAVKSMDKTCLCIQGPPGAGKTYTAQRVITALIQQGKRVGIMSNNHAAIMNLLLPLSGALIGNYMVKVGGYGNTQADFQSHVPDAPDNLVYRPQMTFTNAKPFDSFKVVGGTAFAFANDVAYRNPLDYLFVDEASQVALANLVAASGAAKNIVLIGDQMQLEQPIQGSHPGQAGLSALEFMLKEHAVIPENTGIFLERTFRMHSSICQPLSEVVYEGRLQADADNDKQQINIRNPNSITQAHGILRVTVKHECNTQKSEEEVERIRELIAELKTGTFTDKQGQQHPITDQDILIVAPYNMQVNLLKSKLGGSYQIGTIDKFQGKEAPVVIISMAVSDVEDSPRGLDFVFDINRLNVAISRAKALAIVVANEGLEQCVVNGLGQIEKVGFYLRLSTANFQTVSSSYFLRNQCMELNNKKTIITWKRFISFTDAKKYSNKNPTIYMQTSRTNEILRIGKAFKGLGTRYNVGYEYTLNAAMWESGNYIYIAKIGVDSDQDLQAIEDKLINVFEPILNKRINQSQNDINIAHKNLVVDSGKVISYNDEEEDDLLYPSNQGYNNSITKESSNKKDGHYKTQDSASGMALPLSRMQESEVKPDNRENPKITKAEAGRIIFEEELKNGLVRKVVINRLKNEAKLTKSGAATYFQNMKKKAGLVKKNN